MVWTIAAILVWMVVVVVAAVHPVVREEEAEVSEGDQDTQANIHTIHTEEWIPYLQEREDSPPDPPLMRQKLIGTYHVRVRTI